MSKESFKNRYKTAGNAFYFKSIPESLEGKSQTIPGQSFTPKELIDRQRRGLPISGKKVTFYDEDGNEEIIPMPDVRKMDLTEIHDMMAANAAFIKETQEALSKAKLAADELAQYEKWKSKYEADSAARKAAEEGEKDTGAGQK